MTRPPESTPLGAKREYLTFLGPEKTAILEKLDAWPMRPVAEKLVESGALLVGEVDEYILYYKRFMGFKGITPRVRCGMFSDKVDAVWHQHILFTQDYAEFCQEIFGRFIHHVPCNIMDLSDEAMVEYGVWLTDYEEVYGPWPPDLAREVAAAVGARGPACTNHEHSDGRYKCNT